MSRSDSRTAPPTGTARGGSLLTGDYETMWAHVPGALVLMLGSGTVLIWALLQPTSVAR